MANPISAFFYFPMPTGSNSSAAFTLNPVEIDFKDSKIMNVVANRDGEPVIQRAKKDQRIRTMTWDANKVNATRIEAVITALEGLVDNYFKFKEDVVGTFSDWTTCKGVNVSKTIRRGGGSPKYGEVVFSFLVTDEGWTSF